jgi:integrase
VSRLARYRKKSPERKLSPNSLTGYCSGLRFFYNETLRWDESKLFIPPRKKPSVLPEVFSPEEVVRLIGAARGLKQRVLLMTAYSAGLRVSELVNLKITDIDAARMTLRVKQVRRQRPLCHLVSESAHGAASVLETLPACDLAFPQPGKERPLEPRGSLAHLPLSEEKSRAEKGPWYSQPSQCFDIITTCSISLILSATLIVQR